MKPFLCLWERVYGLSEIFLKLYPKIKKAKELGNLLKVSDPLGMIGGLVG